MQGGLRHAEYVSLTGKLIERTAKRGSRSKKNASDITTVLVLQGTNFTFTAEADDVQRQPELGGDSDRQRGGSAWSLPDGD
ncbi:MAG: hypothetical protein WDM76_04115 [Limisphaerales bacterium]